MTTFFIWLLLSCGLYVGSYAVFNLIGRGNFKYTFVGSCILALIIILILKFT